MRCKTKQREDSRSVDPRVSSHHAAVAAVMTAGHGSGRPAQAG